MQAQSKYIILAAALFLISLEAVAQPGNPGNPAPLGFTELLIGAGVVYGGARKLRKRGLAKGE